MVNQFEVLTENLSEIRRNIVEKMTFNDVMSLRFRFKTVQISNFSNIYNFHGINMFQKMLCVIWIVIQIANLAISFPDIFSLTQKIN